MSDHMTPEGAIIHPATVGAWAGRHNLDPVIAEPLWVHASEFHRVVDACEELQRDLREQHKWHADTCALLRISQAQNQRLSRIEILANRYRDCQNEFPNDEDGCAEWAEALDAALVGAPFVIDGGLAMNLDEAQALLLLHKIARDHPALMAIIAKMEGAGYPNTAGVIAGFAATLAAEDVETVIGVLARDWG